MLLQHFAHNGVDHNSAAEAAAHDSTSNWPVILAITAVALLAALVIAKILSATAKEAIETKDKEIKKK